MKFPIRSTAAASSPIKPFNVSRRSFLKRCSIAAAMTGLPPWFTERELLGAETATPLPAPNDRPGIALIGCGGQGGNDLRNAANFGDVIAVCDVDESRANALAEEFAAKGGKPATYEDFRKVLDRPDVHIIINATPDHWHTLINLAAVRAGKDVYAEKPLTLTIDEGRHLIAAVRDNQRVLQTGSQQRSSARFRFACELVRNERIGKLKEAKVWLPAGRHGGPFAASAVPAGLNWDFWQGQAPAVDYVKERCHSHFRFWYEYSGGTLTDWGAHHNDIAYWAIGLVAPRHVESTVLSEPVAGGYTTYADYQVKCTYENGVGLTINSTQDENVSGEVVNQEGQRNGIRFEGSDGWIWVNRSEITASNPEILNAALPENAVRLYNSKNHLENFFDCVRSRGLPVCDVETGHRAATMCHLGTISLRTGKKLTWDYKSEKFVGENAAEANTYLSREMRKPYDYTFVS